jgi:hypothetical protein
MGWLHCSTPPSFQSFIHSAIRGEEKCLAKYGSGYKEFMRLVLYKILPFTIIIIEKALAKELVGVS